MNTCTPLPASVDMSESLTTALSSLDCQLNSAVAHGYGRFLGPAGLFSTTLTIVLTIYVAVIALRILAGHTNVSLRALTPRAVLIGLVVTFATAWPAYQTVVFDLLTRGPEQISSALLGDPAGATRGFALRLDALFDRFIDLAQGLASKGQSGQLAARWVWSSTVLLMLSTVGVMVIVKLVLAILLALGPLFLVFALFGGTRGLFEGWLKAAVAFALAPLFVVIGGSGAIAIMDPMIASLLDDPAALATDIKPVMMLFMGTVVYAAALITLFWVAFGITRHWRVRFAQEPAMPDAATSSSGAQHSAVSSVSHMKLNQAEATQSDSNARVSSVLTALHRHDERATVSAASMAVPTEISQRASARRLTGLGQTQRPTRVKAGFSRRVQA